MAGNVSYGLRLRKLPARDVERRLAEGLRKVNLAGFESRYPGQLSGGQQQRVALARALVLNPDILLLDEPLSNLDAKIRVQVRSEIRRLQQDLGITTIYVTHDQEEALSLSDRIAVMKDGHVLQVGAPRELYERPQTRFVADFVGTNNFEEAATAPYQLTSARDGHRPHRIVPRAGDPTPSVAALQSGGAVVFQNGAESLAVKGFRGGIDGQVIHVSNTGPGVVSIDRGGNFALASA